jgi:uncharacterized protein YfaS (alpha-2-macroglobulin family)
MLRYTLGLSFSLLCGSALAQQAAAPAFTHSGTARDAARYETQLKSAVGQQGQNRRARDIRLAAEKLLATDPRGAMRQLSLAAGMDASDWETWLSLSRALLAVKPEANSREQSDLPVNASAAAFKAFEAAPTAAGKARALAVLGDAFRRRALWRPAIDAHRASLALAENETVRKTYEALRAQHGFRMMDYTVENEAADPRLCVQLSEAVQRAGTDLTKFVTIDGKEPDAIGGEDRQVCVEGLQHGKRYEIVLRAGLPSTIGEALLKPAVIPVYVRDRAPAVRFSGKNYVLPSRGQQGLPVVSINTTRIGIEVYRVADRNLTAVTGSNGDFMKQLAGHELQGLANDRGAKIYTGELEVTPKLNSEVTTAVPIGEAVPQLKPGVYAMVAKPVGRRSAGGDDDSGSASVATQWFIVSDLGLAAFTGDNGLHAFVRSLTSTEPIANASVRVVARNNEILAQGRTDGAGHVRFEPGHVRGEGGLQAALLVAEAANGQYAFLDIGAAAFDLSDRGVKGREKAGAIDAFLYSDRGIYRPGETVHLNAMVRDRVGNASGLPTTLIVARPDGVEHSRIALTDLGLGGRAHPLRLSGSAMTGTWRVRLHADPKADPLSVTSFLVEDFVPEKLELRLNPAAPALVPEVPATINVTGRYLYGPPAANLAAEGEIVVKAATGAARDNPAFPGYRFGNAEEKITPVRKTLEGIPATNDKGELPLEVTLPPIPRTVQPLTAEVVVRLREPGGRAIERKVSLPVDPRLSRIGIKPLFADDAIGEGETAQFEAIILDEQSRRLGGKRLAWTLYRLDTSWQWYRRDDAWQYEQVTLTRKVGNGLLDSQTDSSARIAQKVDYGRYRLEVASLEPGGPSSSVVFSAGWYASEQADTPEMLDVALDKPSYKPGDTARLKIATRQGGKMLVTVLGSGLIAHRTVDIANGGGEVAIDVGRDWGAGAYVTASLYRPLDERARRMPTRAIGLKWLQVDQSELTLKVALAAPDKIGSGAKLSVPLKVEGLAPGEDARVTVSAVDVGILNLTRFEAPKPEGWFYAQTKLGTEIRDLYGRLIDGMRAERGKLRSGGDESAGGGMSMSGSPPVEKLLALHSGIVRVGPDGTARVEFDLPDFNGQVRLMAVAWSGNKIGHGVKDVIARDPVALTATTPRFMTLGDEARIDLSLHNVEGAAGAYRLAIERETAAGQKASVVQREVRLALNERRSERLTVKPAETGLVSYDVRITGPGGIDVKRRLTLDVKVPGGDIKRVTVAKLAPRTGKITLSKDLLADLIPSRTSVGINVGPVAAFDVTGLLTQLDRYPYGCAEQTTSRALPLLYANEMSSRLGLRADADLKDRVQGAIERVLEMQNSSGAFGVWGPRNPDMWLTAYVTDFLTRAKEAGYEVKPQAFTAALDRLQSFVSYAQDFEAGGEDRAYALYVLTRNGRAPAGELRYYADTRLDRFGSSLAKAQLGAALAMVGERERAERVFRAALELPVEKGFVYRPDYGSRLRDGAGLVSLASEVNIARSEVPRLADVLAKAFSERTYTSTQEQAWMLLAVRALSEQARETDLNVGGVAHKGGLSRRLTGAELINGQLVVTNAGEHQVDAVVSVIGAALTPEPAVEKGFKIERSYYTLDGKKVDLASASGGQGSLRQNDRLVVVVKVDATEKGGRVLLVDRLPAGLEIENPRLVESGDAKSLEWLKTAVKPEHTEFRDDRFVAAFNLSGRQRGRGGDDDDEDAPKGPVGSATVAYMVRAVTPGSFVHPAATVEDMYRPERYARTAAGRLTVTARD